MGDQAEPVTVPAEVAKAARAAGRVVVLSGAGMSAESGVPTFRDAQTGLWERYSAEDLASVDAWERDRAFVFAWYLWRFGGVARVSPNAGHLALARWSADGPSTVSVVTQNVDDLHERAGSASVVHLHGSLASFRCERCEVGYDGVLPPWQEAATRVEPPLCAACGASVRPGVVWFGEALPEREWHEAVALVEGADLVLVVGTSGIVWPAAGLPAVARAAGAVVVEVNPRETETSDMAHHLWRETAARALPALLEEVRRDVG